MILWIDYSTINCSHDLASKKHNPSKSIQAAPYSMADFLGGKMEIKSKLERMLGSGGYVKRSKAEC